MAGQQQDPTRAIAGSGNLGDKNEASGAADDSAAQDPAEFVEEAEGAPGSIGPSA